MQRQVKIQSIFPIEIILYTNGKVRLKDLQGTVYEIRNKDNSFLTEQQYNTIIEEQMGFWQLASKFLLIIKQDS